MDLAIFIVVCVICIASITSFIFALKTHLELRKYDDE